MNKRTLITATVAVGAGALLALAAPLAASAHVEVTPNTAAAGTYADITFRVPTESATATTTKVEVDIPAATPFPSVSYVAVPGWDTELVTETLPKPVKEDKTTITEAVTKVIWTAQPGSEIKESEIRQFTLSVGAVPDTGKIVLNAVQTYSDGSVVEWTGTGESADHPSPVLYVNDKPAAEHDADAVSAPAAAHDSEAAASSSASSSDTLARVLGIGGLVVGAVGVVLSVVTLRRKATV
ncbi:YcnI family protein [Glaciihabitans sp. INWT7]|uniref:YcnI family copper-binding membrane protein n=1 Tax=Glaciihabitans sp. INWT7 TaxID=2596912 RepID=UPI00162809EF|nr:YcnI family protein [Glaciihabitans sp. INWT7]QNE47172.1 YcnI family protein [Glaciihabitans sp. INWT7]